MTLLFGSKALDGTWHLFFFFFLFWHPDLCVGPGIVKTITPTVKSLESPRKLSPPYGWPRPKGGKEGAKTRQTRDNIIWEEVKSQGPGVSGWLGKRGNSHLTLETIFEQWQLL